MCNREAPGLEQFARDSNQVQVVGLGTQDSFSEAGSFRARADIEAVDLLWDSGFTSWQFYDITSQPSAILYDIEGRELGRWSGAFDPTDVLDALD